MRKTIVLQSAASDYKKIKNYVTKKFGENTWNAIHSEWKDKITKLAINPDLGSNIQELHGTGFTSFKKYHYKNTFIVYHCSDDFLMVYMFIPSMRDFRKHLMERLLSSDS